MDDKNSLRSRRIGILGGTFNPVHLGHIDIAKKACGEFSLDLVYLMVSGDPPHKAASSLAPARDRLAMVRLACEECSGIECSDIELLRPGKIYTVDTLRLLKKNMPDDSIYYIIGSDTLYELESWKDAASVFELTGFICMKRKGRDSTPDKKKAQYLKDVYGANILLAESEGPEISSTLLRDGIASNSDVSGLVDEKVREYILKHGLYK